MVLVHQVHCWLGGPLSPCTYLGRVGGGSSLGILGPIHEHHADVVQRVGLRRRRYRHRLPECGLSDVQRVESIVVAPRRVLRLRLFDRGTSGLEQALPLFFKLPLLMGVQLRSVFGRLCGARGEKVEE